MNNPIWIDDKGKIVEPEYCRDFLSRHPMRCINDHFYTVDGPLPDESKLKRTIYEEISPWLHDKVAQTVEQVLKTLKLAAYADPLPLQCDRIHVANGTYFLDGTFTEEKEYCSNRLSVSYRADAPAPEHWLRFLSELLEPEERARIQGLIINKFRGDVEILRPGLTMLEEKTRLPVLGVVPYLNVDIEDEDSLSQRLDVKNVVKPLDVAIIRLPRLSNFTDFISLEQHPLLGVRYVESTRGLGAPDCIILPGTKNTVDDLLWLRQSGLEAAILKLAERGTPILGVCGGYQMLGQQLDDPTGSESGRVQSLRGLGLLPTRTVFSQQKRRTQVTATVTAEPFAGAKLTGYEIHTGRTVVEGTPFDTLADGQPEGCVNGSVFGTYLHGLFDTGELTEKLTVFLCKQKGIAPEAAALVPMEQYRQQQFDLLADGVRGALDMAAVYRAMGMER